jgi:acetyl-CoA carboxylase carboxyl transferase alpha subunit
VVDRLLGWARDRDAGASGSATAAAPSPGTPAAAGAVAARNAVWARVLLARNARRPHTLELVAGIADRFTELHGDRLFGDDGAIVGGVGRIGGRRVLIVGHQKGADTDENIRRNFGMGKPEGFRKAIRLFELADRFGISVVTLVDTPGAYPGAEAEERGVAEAIARAIMTMCRIRVPIVTVITGEGGSGGALAIAAGDVVIALENAVYAVISPEGCASILWRTAEKAPDAALAMRMSAADQLAIGVIDQIVPEPGEGAHADPAETARRLRGVIVEHLDRLAALPADELVAARMRRYRGFGAFDDVGVADLPEPSERPGLADRLRRALEPMGTRLGNLGAREGRDEPPAREEV